MTLKTRSNVKSTFSVIETKVTPYLDQKLGTSGLRKKVKVFQQPHYTETFTQSIFDGLKKCGIKVEGSIFLLGGDGRFYSYDAVKEIVPIAAANGVGKIILGQGCIMSTPAMANLIVKQKAQGGILLTASHNPGGIDKDFGMKVNLANGGPAPVDVTDVIYEKSMCCNKLIKADIEVKDHHLNEEGSYVWGDFVLEVVEPVSDYVEMLKEIFDFDKLKRLMARADFEMRFDGMNGVSGPYAEMLFIKEFGCADNWVTRSKALPDFGGIHPDPNLVYAKGLVDLLFSANSSPLQFGAACDGDADRNMILGRKFFVNPSDSVAVIAEHAAEAIPYFKTNPLTGVARSMATSSALDRVAKVKGYSCYETPTGWRFFGNLMDSGKIQLCGEESFGTSASHVREKDGLWAVCAWLSILAHFNSDETKPFVSVQQIVQQFWKKYGRCFYSRYDYEGVETASAEEMWNDLQMMKTEDVQSDVPESLGKLSIIDNFVYIDPVDSSVAQNQGVRFIFEDGSRIVWRLSGTGSVGATIRIYFERIATDDIDAAVEDYMKDLVAFALEVSRVHERTGRSAPDVIT